MSDPSNLAVAVPLFALVPPFLSLLHLLLAPCAAALLALAASRPVSGAAVVLGRRGSSAVQQTAVSCDDNCVVELGCVEMSEEGACSSVVDVQ